MTAPRPVPVTVVTGFLGAGKTTLLTRALAQARAEGWRVAVVVNDLGGPGVDAETLRRHHATEAEDLVALSGGSVGGDLAGELSRALDALAASGRYTHVVVETSGTTDPAAVLGAAARVPGVTLARTVALLDARALVLDGDARALFAWLVRDEAEGTASPAWLLMRQLAAADAVTLTKADLAGEEALQLAALVARQLAPHAAVCAAIRGEGAGALLFSPPGDITEGTADAALARLAATRPADAEAAGLVAQTIRSRRALHPARFHRLVSGGLPRGLFRAKGVLWLPSRPYAVFHLNLAAAQLELELAGYWKAAALTGPVRLSGAERAALRAALDHPVFGDRETELVLLGTSEAVAEATRGLRRCLLTDAEVGRWQAGLAFPDPWPTRLAPEASP